MIKDVIIPKNQSARKRLRQPMACSPIIVALRLRQQHIPVRVPGFHPGAPCSRSALILLVMRV
jgi:hypothetical protein